MQNSLYSKIVMMLHEIMLTRANRALHAPFTDSTMSTWGEP
jgi:hypothetical protein